MVKTAALLFFSILFTTISFSQKVGLVLSGGGASGMAHIGVLKALEENNIPIDYITGTSSGALIGALYSIGYSPSQIEAMFKSQEFRNWTYGKIDKKYSYYFKKNQDDASWIEFKVSLKSALETTIPTNVINSLPIDFALMEIFAKAGATSNYQFDSLMIPFRCLASDIETKQSIVFKTGDLGEAVRASMSYPFYLRPIYVKQRLMFDGGLYNNFPSDIMYNDFFPDFMIGSNVTENDPPPDDDNIISQVRTMMRGKTNFQLVCENGVLIEPQTSDVGVFDFDNAQTIIDSGYRAASRKIEILKKCIERRVAPDELAFKRLTFIHQGKPLQFDSIIIEGVTKKQQQYIKNTINYNEKLMDIEKIKKQYYKLAVDDKIKSIFPKAVHNEKTGNYILNLNTKKEKDLIVYFGGNFSSRPISEGFVAAQYNHLSKTSVTASANAYFGKLYNSAQGKIHWDIPYKIPFYLEALATYNRWDYYKSSDFFGDVKPAYLIQGDQFAELNIGAPAGHSAKIIIGGGIANFNNKYYQTDKFDQQDTADRNTFLLNTGHFTYEINSLNKKMYANEGTFFQLKARYIKGNEYNQPGSTGIDTAVFRHLREWIQIKATVDHYIFKNKKLNVGFFSEAIYSSQPLFANYSATVLSSPALQPIPESKTFFINSYRCDKYIAFGLKNVISIRKDIDLRLEGYLFLPYQAIMDNNHIAILGKEFQTKHYLATAALVYHSPVGPLSFSLNYYDSNPNSFSFLFHFGYILFNKRALE